MTIPAIFYGVLLSSFFGAAFHFWKGGGGIRLVFYLLLAWVGFWAGHLTGFYLEWEFGTVGPLQAVPASFSSLLFLFIGDWLSDLEQ